MAPPGRPVTTRDRAVPQDAELTPFFVAHTRRRGPAPPRRGDTAVHCLVLVRCDTGRLFMWHARLSNCGDRSSLREYIETG